MGLEHIAAGHLIDQADASLEENEELRALPGSAIDLTVEATGVTQVSGERQPVRSSTFAPAALAGTGGPPGGRWKTGGVRVPKPHPARARARPGTRLPGRPRRHRRHPSHLAAQCGNCIAEMESLRT